MSLGTEDPPYVVVRCPSNDEASFASRWLAAAVEADLILERHAPDDGRLKQAVDRIGIVYQVQFAWPALEIVRRWLNTMHAFALSLHDDQLFESFPYLALVGFFTQVDTHYQMSIPREVSPALISSAMIQFAETEEDDSHLHPERFLTTMTETKARRDVTLIDQRLKMLRADPFDGAIH